MAKHISEILAIGENRKDSQTYNVIHLFKEGAFYRAYESAWLSRYRQCSNWKQPCHHKKESQGFRRYFCFRRLSTHIDGEVYSKRGSVIIHTCQR